MQILLIVATGFLIMLRASSALARNTAIEHAAFREPERFHDPGHTILGAELLSKVFLDCAFIFFDHRCLGHVINCYRKPVFAPGPRSLEHIDDSAIWTSLIALTACMTSLIRFSVSGML